MGYWDTHQGMGNAAVYVVLRKKIRLSAQGKLHASSHYIELQVGEEVQ